MIKSGKRGEILKKLVIRYVSLAIATSTILIHTILSDGAITSAIFIVTAALCLYFFIPLMKKPIINYLLIIMFLPISAYASLDILYALPFLTFFVIEGSFQLHFKAWCLFIISTLSICTILVFLNFIPIYVLLLIFAIAACSLLLQYYVSEITQKSELYEALLGQYGLLKRLSVEQDKYIRSEERTKIARDMHDSVGHKLTALLMQLEMLSIQNKNEELHDVKRLARESLDETRYAVRQLKSNNTSGIQSVIQLIRKLEMESHLHIRFTFEKGVLSLPITNEQSIVLYRVIQESLTNAMKHSDSKEVDVILGLNSLQHVQFEVKNKTLSKTKVIHGFGLTNMGERLQEIGGGLRILRTEEQFIVKGFFPLKESA